MTPWFKNLDAFVYFGANYSFGPKYFTFINNMIINTYLPKRLPSILAPSNQMKYPEHSE